MQGHLMSMEQQTVCSGGHAVCYLQIQMHEPEPPMATYWVCSLRCVKWWQEYLHPGTMVRMDEIRHT